MCNKLLHIYACGHQKTICTTPCTHALRSSQPPALPNNTSHNNSVSCSSSTVSSLAAQKENTVTNFSRPQTNAHSPLRVTNPTSPPTSPTQVPTFRFVAPSSPRDDSPVSPVSPSFTQRAQSSAPPSRFPSPAPTDPDIAPETDFCAYYIPRYLVPSKYPCIECYAKDDWEELRGRWMENYRLGHPLESAEGVEKWSGVGMVMVER